MFFQGDVQTADFRKAGLNNDRAFRRNVVGILTITGPTRVIRVERKGLFGLWNDWSTVKVLPNGTNIRKGIPFRPGKIRKY